jgi:hypothetical protein
MVSIGFLRVHWLRFSATSSEYRISLAVKGARKDLPRLHNAHSLRRQIASLDRLLWTPKLAFCGYGLCYQMEDAPDLAKVKEG